MIPIPIPRRCRHPLPHMEKERDKRIDRLREFSSFPPKTLVVVLTPLHKYDTVLPPTFILYYKQCRRRLCLSGLRDVQGFGIKDTGELRAMAHVLVRVFYLHRG